MYKKLLAFVVLVFVLSSCFRNSSCKSKLVLLNEDSFSVHVIADPIFSPLSGSPNDSAGRVFYVKHEDVVYSVLQTVENYTFASRASKEYAAQEKVIFKSDDYQGPWSIPENIDEQKLSAAEFHLACGEIKPFPYLTCHFIARYENYLTFLSANIGGDGFTLTDFIDVAREIDERMVQCLGE